jgi:predicted histone-like DNA-binding protein
MTVKFNIVERGNPSNPEAPKKYYPSIQSSGRVTLRELAEQASQMSTLTTTDIVAAIESFLTIVPKELAKGNIMELGGFGSFWLKTTTEGAETAEAVRANQISTILPRFNPGKEFKRTLGGHRIQQELIPASQQMQRDCPRKVEVSLLFNVTPALAPGASVVGPLGRSNPHLNEEIASRRLATTEWKRKNI